VTAVHSPWEFLRQINPDLAASEAQLSVLVALLPFAAPLQRWLDTETHTLRLSARVRAMSSDQFLELAEHVEQQAGQMHLPVEVTGSTYLLAQMSRSLVQTQIRSLLLAALLILGVIALFLGTWQLGLIAAIPNVLPPLMIFGLMGWCGIALSTATTMIASVALGLIVDNTIHLLYRYRHEKKTAQTTSRALIQTVHHTGRAVIFTAIILTLGFWAGVIGSFKPTIYFSFLTGLTMIFALLADLLLLPATLLAWERGWRGLERSDVP
jgi:predicted RND superfamily exporter protein